jgi:hypothetical protein
MSYAHGERLLSIILAMVMGKPHDDIFGHICIYRRFALLALLFPSLIEFRDRQA